MPAPYRLLVFDWDGTLLDSVDSIVACTRHALEEIGLPELPEGKIRGMIGLGLTQTVRTLCPPGQEELGRRVVETYRRHWFATYRFRNRLFEGVPEALESLRDAGYLLAVATAKPRRGLAADLEHTGLTEGFHASRTGDEAPAKPAPTMLLELLEELDVEADRALMIGDTVHDLEMASNAGVAAVGVTSGAQPEDRLRDTGPLACLAGVAELPAWLTGAGAAGRPG